MYSITPIRHAEQRGADGRVNSCQFASRSLPQLRQRASFGDGLVFFFMGVSRLAQLAGIQPALVEWTGAPRLPDRACLNKVGSANFTKARS